MSSPQTPVVVYSKDNDAAFQIVQWLEMLQLSMEFVSSLKGGLDIVRSASPGAVILDLQSPAQETQLLLQELVPQNGTQRCPVLGIGSKYPGTAKGIELQSFDHIFSRPLEQDDFVPVIQKILSLDLPETETAHPVFNRQKAMSLLGEDEAILKIALSAFREDTPEIMSQLEQAVAKGDAEEARRCCHTLEGSASTISADSFDQTLRQIHRLLRKNNLEEAQCRSTALRKEYDSLLDTLAQELKNML